MSINEAKSLKIGTTVISTECPEWGQWTITEVTNYDDTMWYDIRSENGNERTLSPYDLTRGFFKVV